MKTISSDSQSPHYSPLSNLAVAKSKETDEDQFYQTTIAPLPHCVILAIVMPQETDEDQFHQTIIAHCVISAIVMP